MKKTFLLLTVVIAWHFSVQAQQSEPHGWLNNETLQTPYGNFEFKNGYPAGDSGDAPARQFRNSIGLMEVYLTQVMRVSEAALREGYA